MALSFADFKADAINGSQSSELLAETFDAQQDRVGSPAQRRRSGSYLEGARDIDALQCLAFALTFLTLAFAA